MDKSAEDTKLTCPVAELLPVFGSGVLEEIEAVSLTSPPFAAEKVTVMVAEAPGWIVLSEQLSEALVIAPAGGGPQVP